MKKRRKRKKTKMNDKIVKKQFNANSRCFSISFFFVSEATLCKMNSGKRMFNKDKIDSRITFPSETENE